MNVKDLKLALAWVEIRKQREIKELLGSFSPSCYCPEDRPGYDAEVQALESLRKRFYWDLQVMTEEEEESDLSDPDEHAEWIQRYLNWVDRGD